MDVLTNAEDERRGERGVSAPASDVVRERRWLIGLLLFALIVRVVTLGAYPLMDNTESRYGEIARKMVETGDWLMPQFKYGVPFWSKPPLSIWMTAMSYVALGVSEFAARLPSLLACLPVAWMTYALAAARAAPRAEPPRVTSAADAQSDVHGACAPQAAGREGIEAGLRATVVLITTPLFFVSAGAVMTDPALFLGTTLSMFGFWRAITQTGMAARMWGYAFFLGLAIGLLAKGPVAAVLTLVPIGAWTLWKGDIRDVWRRLPWISGLLLTVALSVPWYLLAEQRTPGFLEYFLVGEHWKRYVESGWKGDMFGTAHSRPRGTIWLFAIASTLPWSALGIALLVQGRRTGRRGASSADDDGWRAYLYLWMLTPAIFFTFAGNILFTYVLPGLPAFALLVGEAWSCAREKGARGTALKYAGILIPAAIALGVVFVLPPIALTNSHQALVSRYLALKKDDARLIYLNEAPQSAEFYARGKLTTLARSSDLEPYLHDASRDFFALTDAQLGSVPGIRAGLSAVGRFGRYTLYEEASAAADAQR